MLNPKSAILFSLIFGLGLTLSQAQDNRILYASSDISQPEQVSPRIISIANRYSSNFLGVKYEDGSKKRIAIKDVWGYVVNGKLYRRYKKDFLEVVSQGEVIQYKWRAIPAHDLMTNTTRMVERPHIFSKTLDGKLYSSAKAALKED